MLKDNKNYFIHTYVYIYWLFSLVQAEKACKLNPPGTVKLIRTVRGVSSCAALWEGWKHIC